MDTFPSVISADKTLAYFPGWQGPDRDGDGYIWFEAPVDIAGVTESGVFFKGRAHSEFPEREVTFELYVRRPEGRRRVALQRIDWNPLKKGHSNKKGYRPAWLAKRVMGTHFHSFDLNWSQHNGRMKGKNLPLAQPVEECLETFDALRAWCGRVFRISNIEIVSPPPWEYTLFDG